MSVKKNVRKKKKKIVKNNNSRFKTIKLLNLEIFIF